MFLCFLWRCHYENDGLAHSWYLVVIKVNRQEEKKRGLGLLQFYVHIDTPCTFEDNDCKNLLSRCNSHFADCLIVRIIPKGIVSLIGNGIYFHHVLWVFSLNLIRWNPCADLDPHIGHRQWKAIHFTSHLCRAWLTTYNKWIRYMSISY